MTRSRSISHFPLQVPLKLDKQILVADFFQINDGGYEVGFGCVTLDKMGPYTIFEDIVVINIEGQREIILHISPYFKNHHNILIVKDILISQLLRYKENHL